MTGFTDSFAPPTPTFFYEARATDGWSVMSNIWRDWNLTRRLGVYGGGGIGTGGQLLLPMLMPRWHRLADGIPRVLRPPTGDSLPDVALGVCLEPAPSPEPSPPFGYHRWIPAMHTPVHDPTAIYRYRDCLAAADCLCAAIAHLDLFTLLDREPATLAGLCSTLGLHARPADVMLTLCAANGLVTLDAAGVCRVTGLAREFLVAGALCDARPYYASMADKPGVADWLKVLRTGRPANWPGEEGEADWHAAMRTEAFAESFTAAMDCRGRVLGPALARAVDLRAARQLLDVGGGSGVYAIACAEANPALRATVLESAPVDRIARRSIDAAGCGDRIEVTTGDMFADAWHALHDVHLFSNVLHDWDEPRCRKLLGTSAAALPAGGRLLVHDTLLDDDKSGPLWAAEYSVLLAGVTRGRIYSAAEITAWAAAEGFGVVGRAATALGRDVLEFVRRA